MTTELPPLNRVPGPNRPTDSVMEALVLPAPSNPLTCPATRNEI